MQVYIGQFVVISIIFGNPTLYSLEVILPGKFRITQFFINAGQVEIDTSQVGMIMTFLNLRTLLQDSQGLLILSKVVKYNPFVQQECGQLIV